MGRFETILGVKPENVLAKDTTKDTTFDPLPSPHDFCLNIPLYEKFRYDSEKQNPFFSLEHYKGPLDCYCHGCTRHTVFNRWDEPEYGGHHRKFNFTFALSFLCSRDKSHQVCFVFHSHEGILQKIGQYPSLADLAVPDLQKYRSVLGDEKFRELTRAVGLASHGVGVGAFVYLRRIFEALIKKARDQAATEQGWADEAFENARMDEKIAILKQHLPKFLVDNRKLYGIMSMGVHTLSESECLETFPVVRVGIELILDEHLEQHARERKIAAATKNISTLGSVLKRDEGM